MHELAWTQHGPVGPRAPQWCTTGANLLMRAPARCCCLLLSVALLVALAWAVERGVWPSQCEPAAL